jgi:hypothetical protein
MEEPAWPGERAAGEVLAEEEARRELRGEVDDSASAEVLPSAEVKAVCRRAALEGERIGGDVTGLPA